MTVRLIQGFSWRRREFLTAGLVLGSDVARSMFAGVIFSGHNNVLVGEMHDDRGKAVLYDIVLLPKEVRFIKKYQGAGKYDAIGYHFQRKGSLWVGECQGLVIGRVAVKCIITVVPEGLFKPDSPPTKKVRRRRR